MLSKDDGMERNVSIKLSVIVPVYNTALYLQECVNSILNQTLECIEIILVDDESPDGAGALCDELKHKYDNITVIHKKNQGLGHARNSGLELAKGKYIAFLDSDDYVEPDYYKNLIAHCEETEASVCYATGYIKFTPNHKSIEYLGNLQGLVYEGNGGNIYR